MRVDWSEDVPIYSVKSANKFKSDGKRGINIEAGSNFIIFKREIKDGKCQLKNDLMVTHRYEDPEKSYDNDYVSDYGYGGGGEEEEYDGGEAEAIIEGINEDKYFKHKIY